MIQRFMIDSQTLFESRFFKNGHGKVIKMVGGFRLVTAKNKNQELG